MDLGSVCGSQLALVESRMALSTSLDLGIFFRPYTRQPIREALFVVLSMQNRAHHFPGNSLSAQRLGVFLIRSPDIKQCLVQKEPNFN